MEGFQIGPLLKTFMLCFLPLLLMLAFPLMEGSLMPTMWPPSLHGVLEGPASAFFLLNCVIVTIIASSKLEGERRGHEEGEESKREILAMGLIEKSDIEKGDNIIIAGRQISHYNDTQVENGYDFHKVIKGESFVRRSWSLNSSFEYNPLKHAQVIRLNYLNEKKPFIKRARIASGRRNDKLGLPHPNNHLKEKQLSCKGSHLEKPALAGNFDNTAVDHPPPQAAPPAATSAHPSMEDVWAAIMSSNKGDDRNIQAPNSQNVKQAQPPPAAAAAAATGSPTAAAATDTPAQPAAAALAVPAEAAGEAPAAAAAEKHVEDGKDEENDRELEELNRRAEEFITRFNRQMRLQREESLQRQKRGRRACNYDVQNVHPCQLRVRGLLVG